VQQKKHTTADGSEQPNQPAKPTKAEIVAHIERAVNLLTEPGQVVELRALKVEGRGNRTDSGYFDDPAKLAAAAFSLEGKAQAVYITLNPVKPDLLARASNRIKQYATETTADPDITKRRWLPLDFDPVRPAGISSSEDEHAAAIAMAERCAEWLTIQGWPAPVAGDSGNGAHLLYLIDLPNDQESADLLKTCMAVLADRFDDNQVTIDRKVFNAARIWKLYGTVARKGDNLQTRPHRRAQIANAPEHLTAVALEQLEDLASTFAVRAELGLENRSAQPSGGYGRAALNSEIAKLRSTTSGRNNQLNASAYALAQLVAGGEIDESTVESELRSAAESIGLGQAEINATLRSALGDGKQKPRQASNDQPGRTAAGEKSVAPGKVEKPKILKHPAATAQPVTGGAKPDPRHVATVWAKDNKANWGYNDDLKRWYHWQGTHWEAIKGRSFQMEAQIADIMGKLGMSRTTNRIDDAIHQAGGMVAMNLMPRPHLINFKNGTLDVNRMEIRAHDREDQLTYCLDYEFERGEYPAITQFLEEVIPDPEGRRAFMAHIGLALLQDLQFHKFLLLYGRPRSGKSTCLDLALAVCGQPAGNYAGDVLFSNDPEGSKSRAAWSTCRLVAIDELPKNAIRGYGEENLKKMSAHGGVAQRSLYQAEQTENRWRPKMIMTTNDRPNYSDRSGALTERLVVVECPNSRGDNAQIKGLLARLLAERSPFAVACVYAAQEVIKAQQYPQSLQMLETRSEVEQTGDSVKAFVSEMLNLVPANFESAQRLYESYKAYCSDALEGQKPISIKSFSTTLKDRFGCKRLKYQGVRGFFGLRFKSDSAESGVSDASNGSADGQIVDASWTHSRQLELSAVAKMDTLDTLDTFFPNIAYEGQRSSLYERDAPYIENNVKKEESGHNLSNPSNASDSAKETVQKSVHYVSTDVSTGVRTPDGGALVDSREENRSLTILELAQCRQPILKDNRRAMMAFLAPELDPDFDDNPEAVAALAATVTPVEAFEACMQLKPERRPVFDDIIARYPKFQEDYYNQLDGLDEQYRSRLQNLKLENDRESDGSTSADS
jgi:phage/plasmid-associated DNA primase